MFTTINIDTAENVTQIQSIVQIFFKNGSGNSRSMHNRHGDGLSGVRGTDAAFAVQHQVEY